MVVRCNGIDQVYYDLKDGDGKTIRSDYIDIGYGNSPCTGANSLDSFGKKSIIEDQRLKFMES